MKMITRVNFRIFTNSPYRSESHILDEFVKILEFILVIIIVIFIQKWQFRLENESFEISRNSAYLYVGHLYIWDTPINSILTVFHRFMNCARILLNDTLTV